jgi:hypothetical protein
MMNLKKQMWLKTAGSSIDNGNTGVFEKKEKKKKQEADKNVYAYVLFFILLFLHAYGTKNQS